MSFSFIQLTDPQFGMFAAFSGLDEAAIEGHRQRGLKVRPAPKITGFATETALYERAIAAANRLRPDFVVVTGDLVQDPNDGGQVAEMKRITAKLDGDIPMYLAAGNADVGNAPTPESIALYRERFGDDNYYFDHRGSRFIVLNSSVCYDPTRVPKEWTGQLDLLKTALARPRDAAGGHIVVFTHHPLFGRDADEEDTFLVLPKERRRVLLDLFHSHGVSAVFSGHWHRNNYASDGKLQMVTSGPVGYPLGDDPSGLRIVRVYEDRIEHDYFGFDDVPDSISL